MAMLTTKASSAFAGAGGFRKVVSALEQEIQALYHEDETPWIIGYSGGKDSTAVLCLIWLALEKLPIDQRHKPVHVISTDTLVENPIVARWVDQSHEAIRRHAEKMALPILPHRLTPAVRDTFWVNLIGKGYPAPRNKFRWCTDRLKIKPSNRFIMDITRRSGRAILALGIRRAESDRRARTMKNHDQHRLKDRVAPNASLPGCFVYSPIEDWTNDDVWFYLMQTKNPWGWDNKALLTMYQGASADGECPLVVDTSTPSCGDSRFGCWVCTLVEQDKSMHAMIQNDAEKEWMLPLLKLRDSLDFRLMSAPGSTPGPDSEATASTDRHLRDFRRMSGTVQFMEKEGQPARVVPGPYTQASREQWLRQLLRAQTHIRRSGPPEVRDISLIGLDELEEIRRIWVFEKHEIEDLLPAIYLEETGLPYPGQPVDNGQLFKPEDLRQLRDLCQDDPALYELCRDILGVEEQHRHKRQRKGALEDLERVLRRHQFSTEQEAAAAEAELEKERLALFSTATDREMMVAEPNVLP